MARATRFGNVDACTNQKGAFQLTIAPGVGVSLTGAVVTCQIKVNAQSATAVLSPTVTTSMSGVNLVAAVSWTQAQSVAFTAPGESYEDTTTYVVEVNLALADAPTYPVMRFYSDFIVSPGGIVT